MELGDGDPDIDLSLDRESTEEGRSARRIIAVGGGKGGAGKSLLAANVAIFLATLGKRVVLLDADLGGANLHTFVGVERPRVTLGDWFEKRVAAIEDVVVETAVPGLGLVSGQGEPSWIEASGGSSAGHPAQKFRFLKQVQKLEVDYLVVDLEAGSGCNAIDFFLLADVGVMVVLPEPTSVENTYRFIKSAFLRHLRRVGLERAVAIASEGTNGFEGGIPAPYDLFMAAREREPALAERLALEIAAFRPRIVVNQVRVRSDLDLGPALVSAARRRLGIGIQYLGHLEHDDAVWLAVRKRKPLLVGHPESRAAKGVEQVTRRLIALETGPRTQAPVRDMAALTHYEILEIDPAATEEEIRRAHRRVRDTYGAESMVICGLYDRERLGGLHARIEAAKDTLMDDARRRAYDLMLFPDGLPQRRRKNTSPITVPIPIGGLVVEKPRATDAEHSDMPRTESSVVTALPPGPDLGSNTVYTGALFKQIRESRGVDLHEISQTTKIGVGHLRAIEEERFDRMPAPVYVRGFLIQYAKALRLDVNRVLATYLEKYREARARLEERD